MSQMAQSCRKRNSKNPLKVIICIKEEDVFSKTSKTDYPVNYFKIVMMWTNDRECV